MEGDYMEEKTIITTMKLLKERRNSILRQMDGEVCNVKYIGNLKDSETNQEILDIYLTSISG